MSRFKTVFFWLFFLAAIGFGVYAYITLRKSKKPAVDALTQVPDSCVVYLSTADLHQLDKVINEQSLITDRLQIFPQVADVFLTLSKLDSLFQSNELLKDQTTASVIHFGLYKDLGWLLTLNIKELGSQEKCVEAIRSSFKLNEIQNVYSGLVNQHPFYFQLRDGVVLISNKNTLLSKTTGSKNKLYQDQKFIRFKSVLSEDHLFSIYVDQSLYSASEANSQIGLALRNRGYFAGAVDLEPSELKINGLQACDSSNQLSKLAGQSPASPENIIQLLPYNTVFFEAYGAEQLNKTYQQNNKASEKFWAAAKEKALYNVQTQFTEILGSHLLRFKTASSAEMFGTEITDSLKADECLTMMSDSTFLVDSIPLHRLLHHEDLPVFFLPFESAGSAYAFRIGNELYFCQKEGDARTLATGLKRQISLAQNVSFVNYEKQNFPDRFHYLFYARPNVSENHFFMLKKNETENPFENFRHFSFSLLAENKDFKFRLHLLHETENKQKNLLWSLKLDTLIGESPQMFINHLTQENEILVQDVANSLYLVNAKGTILWEKKLGEKIISKIYMVDMFKNNKFQMLFNTTNAIHLLDRKGHYVEGYPIRLLVPASNGLSLFDYDNNKEYRYFIACTNRNIYNYGIAGKRQEGFVNVRTEAEVQLPIQYVSIGQSQYLVALDKEGKFYTFSRKGAMRISLKNRAVVNCRCFYIDASGSLSNSYLVYVDDKTALLNRISFTDIKSITHLNTETNGANSQFITIDENRSTDLLLSSGSKVSAIDFSGNLILEKDAGETLDKSGYYTDESHSMLYSYSKEAGAIFTNDLLHETDARFNGSAFPMLSDLFKDQKIYLIVPDGKSLNCLSLD